MRCQTLIPTIWTNRRRILHPWFNKSLFIFFYFVVILLDFSANVQCSSQVYHNESGADAKENCSNYHTEAVQCLIHELTDCQEMANKSYRLFCEVMSQFDCTTTYSVKWNCTDCLDAYTNWLLAVFSPNKTWFSKCAGSKTTTSIFSLCEEVLRKCPNFIPDKPYGDLPAFGCLKEENQDEVGENVPQCNGTTPEWKHG